jgi:serine protease Do
MRSLVGLPKFGALVLLAASMLAWSAKPALGQDDGEDEAKAAKLRSEMYESLAREGAGIERQSNVLKTVVKLVRPTVVHIEAEKTDAAALRYGRKSNVEEAGSGCLIRLNGRDYVITNRHVIRGADYKRIRIRLADGREINPLPKKVWSDDKTDIAIMGVNASGLVPARLGNSDEVEIGDFVLAVGSPFGLSHSMTFGIVSATGRHHLVLGEDVQFQDFIQTDAAINPGNSGGPLINLRGEVIGMNTAIASSSGANEGVGFSIAINKVVMVAKQLVEHNTVTRAFLGVKLDSTFDSATAISVGLKRPRGARVNDVTPGSPAALAKLQRGDIVVEYAGISVDNDLHLINMVGMTEVGREVPLSIYRDQKLYKVNVRLAASEKPASSSKAPATSTQRAPAR